MKTEYITPQLAQNIIKKIENDETYKTLRGLLSLYVDNEIAVDALYQQPVFQQFVRKQKKSLQSSLLDTTDKQHFSKSLSEVFKQLEEKSTESGTVEYAYIKLKAASWMIEMPNKYSRKALMQFIKEIYTILPAERCLDKIARVAKVLSEAWLFEVDVDAQVYRLWFSIDSDYWLNICIEHDENKTEGWFSGYFFLLSDTTEEITKFLQSYGYDDWWKNQLDSMIWPIITIKDKEKDEDEDASFA
jgi:hypothetical protein